MIDAPTKEIAIGMKRRDLGSDSRFMRLSMIAKKRPSAVVANGVIKIQRRVLTITL